MKNIFTLVAFVFTFTMYAQVDTLKVMELEGISVTGVRSDTTAEVSYYNSKIEELMKLQMFGSGLGDNKGKIDLYLLTYPDLDWDDDGTRDFDKLEDRMRSFKWIKAQLDANGCKYHIIMGKGERRTEKAIEIINHCEKEFREKPWHKLSFDR